MSLRFLAGTCVFSGWITLALSVVLAIFAFIGAAGAARTASTASKASTNYFPSPSTSGTPGLPGASSVGLPGVTGAEEALGDLGIGGLPGMPGRGGLAETASWMKNLYPLALTLSGVITLVTGAVTCLLFLGLGQVCYVLLDLEEQSLQLTETLRQLLIRR